MAIQSSVRHFWGMLIILLLIVISATFGFAQEEEEVDDIAFSRGGQVWHVVEKSGSEHWNATWTLRPDAKTFDAHWKHYPGGNEGNLSGFAKISRLQGSEIVIDRQGLGKYTGTISKDRTSIKGRMSWSGGTWEAKLEPDALPKPSAEIAVGSKWDVVESTGHDRWTSVWTVRKDGRSFDATWTHTPGNDSGRLTNFARVSSISGSQITIDRPGLGKYTGTISSDRKSINGKMSWSSGTWHVTLHQSKLPTAMK